MDSAFIPRLAAFSFMLMISAACGRETNSGEGTLTSAPVTDGALPSSPASYSPLPPSAFRVEWKAVEVPRDVRPGDTLRFDVTVRNAGDVVWPDLASSTGPPPGAGAVRLGHRWWRASEEEPGPASGYSASRVDLPSPLPPGGEATLHAEIKAPEEPGAYKLEIDLVQELVAWFGSRGAERLVVDVSVR